MTYLKKDDEVDNNKDQKEEVKVFVFILKVKKIYIFVEKVKEGKEVFFDLTTVILKINGV